MVEQLAKAERTKMVSDEHMLSLGRQSYDEYSSYAAQSSVPPNFYRISRRLTLETYREFSIGVVAGILFDCEFEDEEEAWKTVRYAEAISAIKGFELDQEGPEPEESDLEEEFSRLELLVGLSEIAVKGEGDKIRRRVERHFSNPMSHVRLARLELTSSVPIPLI